MYDDILDTLEEVGSEYFDIDEGDCDWLVDQAIHDRILVLDKGKAFKYGRQPNTFNQDHVGYQKRYPRDSNRNVNDKDTWRDWSAYDKDISRKFIRDKFPNLVKVTKDGKYPRAKGWRDAFEKDIYGTDQADKRPLHRKGSLNRAMDESKLCHLVESKVKRYLTEVLRRQ